jgi:UDP-galactopyranose mutase
MMTDEEIINRWNDCREGTMHFRVLGFARAIIEAERMRWIPVVNASQAITVNCVDNVDNFTVPSHLMAALALALDEASHDSGYRRDQDRH